MSKKKQRKEYVGPVMCLDCAYCDMAESKTMFGCFCTADGCYYFHDNDEEDCCDYVYTHEAICWSCQHCNKHTRGDWFEDFIICKKPFSEVSTHSRSDTCSAWELSDDEVMLACILRGPFDDTDDEYEELFRDYFYDLNEEQRKKMIPIKRHVFKKYIKEHKQIKNGQRKKYSFINSAQVHSIEIHTEDGHII